MAANEKNSLTDTADSLVAVNVSSNDADEELACTSAVLSQSENSNNENREKELEGNETIETDDLPQENNPETPDAINITERLKDISSESDNVIPKTCPPENESTNSAAVSLEEQSAAPSNVSEDDYSKFVSYNKLGIAIYIDPSTKLQYEYDKEKSEWILATEKNRIGTDCSTNTENNPYENEHYRWCHQTNQWLPKSNVDIGTATENEFYKWDSVKNEWIPKTGVGSVSSEIIDGIHQYTDADGAQFFWDTEKNAWFPKIDDDFMAKYQMAYGFVDNTTSDGDVEKNLQEDSNCDNDNEDSEKIDKELGKGGKRKVEPPQWFEMSEQQNTKVYVENLPLDVTEQEFIDIMSKYGLIFRDPSSGKFKVKLYTDSNGQLKGDGLCTYIKIESVNLALTLLDGLDVRGHKVKVQRAKFQMRGEYNPALRPKKKKADKDKAKKMQEKLFDWRPEKMRGERSKHERTVIIKNLFVPELFEKEVELILEYQKDLREECEKCGTVRKVIIFDRHPEGVAQINMGDPDEADLVIQMMNKRYFGQRQLIAETWDGKTKYKIDENVVETDKRLSNWDKFLETGEELKESVTTKTDDTADKS